MLCVLSIYYINSRFDSVNPIITTQLIFNMKRATFRIFYQKKIDRW